MRSHGFSPPFHPLQVVSWFVFGGDVVIFAIVGLPQVETVGGKIVASILYLASVTALVAATFKATACNPVDPHVLVQEDIDPTEADLDNWPYCSMCDCHVNAKSKHCRICNKCVDVFDHHCMWLNNCIGRHNYKSFIVTISSVAVMIGIVLVVCIYLIIDYFTDEVSFQQRMALMRIFSNAPQEVLLGLLLTLVIVNLPLFFLDMQLVLLHAFLSSQQLTTYEYIMNKRSQGQAEERSASESSDANAPPEPRRKPMVLPRCMDWIVFCRCGQRRKNKDSIQPIEAPPPDKEARVVSGTANGLQPTSPSGCPQPGAPDEPPHRPSRSKAVGSDIESDFTTTTSMPTGQSPAPQPPLVRSSLSPGLHESEGDSMPTAKFSPEAGDMDQRGFDTGESAAIFHERQVSTPDDCPRRLGCGCDSSSSCTHSGPGGPKGPEPSKL